MEMSLPSDSRTEYFRGNYLDGIYPFDVGSSDIEGPATRSRTSRLRDKRWRCHICGTSYTRSGNLRNHERTNHHFYRDKAKRSQKEGSCSSAKAQDDRMAKSTQSNFREVSPRNTSPLQLSKNDWGGVPVPFSLIHRLEFCLSELSSQSTKGFRIPLVIKTDGVATNINIDVYDKSQALLTDSSTTQLGLFKTDVPKPEPEPRPEQLRYPPPPPQQVLKVRRRRASMAMENMQAVMDQRPITTIQAPKIMSDPHNPLILWPFEDVAHSSSKDKAKLMDYRTSDIIHELIKVEPGEIKAEASRIEAEFSKRRENSDDDVSRCFGALVDSSEEGDDSDSDSECDNVTTWNFSQHDALPSFLPYIRGHDAGTSSPCGDSPCGDSPDSGSTTSGTTSDTPASSSSGLTGGNGLQGNGNTSPSAGIGASNNSDEPILGIKDGIGTNFASDPQPLPLICWYSAAGIACSAKHVKMSTEVRHLWK